MNTWQHEDARSIAAPQEVQLAPRRVDGSLRAPRTTWIVAFGDRVFVRSTNGGGASWFKAAIATGSGQITARGTAYDVAFTEADTDELAAIGDAYRNKYGRYASIVDHLEEPGPRAATLEVTPA
ncbi:MAG TPA: DUF2255 family protein [Aldersonia sp.]